MKGYGCSLLGNPGTGKISFNHRYIRSVMVAAYSFIDEAYQLTSGNNSGGRAVLDYLLPEVENLKEKVVFVLAGHSKQIAILDCRAGSPSK